MSKLTAAQKRAKDFERDILIMKERTILYDALKAIEKIVDDTTTIKHKGTDDEAEWCDAAAISIVLHTVQDLWRPRGVTHEDAIKRIFQVKL